ncbi:MAG TPA: tannase/feruloyl esterase family alpha/beta hydrolase [Blastocatellia bacterium]|nr:tannase/feruloyl esterase family alpha/beta hydrolase [Blastocatellia bacterium]
MKTVKTWLGNDAILIASLVLAKTTEAQVMPVTTCDAAGIGSTLLRADGPPVSILEVSTGTAGTGESATPYCLVKVLVPQAINIWVGLPMGGKWNGRLQSQGGGGYSGGLGVPTASILGGMVGVSTDTGHPGDGGGGSFGLLSPGVPNTQLQIDFAYRSEHLMAVIGKQLTRAFYGRQPEYSYWNGCSTGGRQGLMMAQRYPDDYDGILAGAPAIHWDRFQAAQIWPQMVMFRDHGGAIPAAKQDLATNAAIAACDPLDGVKDGVIADPRRCRFDAKRLLCPSGVNDNTCLTLTEAVAINKIWQGPVLCPPGDSDNICSAPEVRAEQRPGFRLPRQGERLWYGLTPGTPLSGLAGPTPFFISVNQPRFWVYLDPTWDWHILNYDNYRAFFDETVRTVGPVIGTDDPDLAPFRERGGKLLIWHGWSDPLIMPEGTVDYYNRVVRKAGGWSYRRTAQFARLFMAPGVFHCGGGPGPAPQNNTLFDALTDWVEHGNAPETIKVSKPLEGGAMQTRPLCPYPSVAVWTGRGSTDDAANFVCRSFFHPFPRDHERARHSPFDSR